MGASGATATTATREELEMSHTWLQRHWLSPRASAPPAGLLVLANHDPVTRNSRGGRPLRTGGKEYRRGLYCHAVSKVVVYLPSPGKEFSAIVGVDTHEQTQGGRGSVVFSVHANGKELYRSKLMREGMPSESVKVDLGGATSFTLEVGDGGDGISCDQSDWADAKVVLADGKELWVGDLPFISPTDRGGPPFSFTCGGRPSSELLDKWACKRQQEKLDDARTRHTITWTDEATGLVVRCVAVAYHDFPTIEWTLYFKTAGGRDTPILAAVQPLDAVFERGDQGEFVLHYAVGSPCSANDFQPLERPLPARAEFRVATSGGRPSNSHMPYFNVAWPGGGAIAALGWPGQWAATFARDEAKGLRVRAGQELTHFKLLPGEEARTPLVVLQFYQGGRIRSQNLWRRWMLAHNLPKPGGKPMPPILIMCCDDHFPGMRSDEAGQFTFIDAYAKAGIPLDYWWMDAGWYPCDPVGWPKVGTWEPDAERFPRGLKAVSDKVHSLGWQLVTWFEPERVHAGTWLAENHPEWVHGGKGGGLLDLGNPDARKWLTDHIDRLLTEQGIDLYRQDFNMDPLGHWRGHDAPDRQGMTEIRHVEGLLAYWDELRRRHPSMPMDTCASGGRRLDLETLRRAVPLLRSDYRSEPHGTQGHTYGLSFWIPYYGTGIGNESPYILRSHYCPCYGVGGDVRRGQMDWAKMKRTMAEWKAVIPCFFGDYYPLTSYSLAGDVWMAWQFDRPESGDGVVMAFRRAQSPYEMARFRLNGLDPDARYTLTDLDTGKTVEATGRELVRNGFPIAIRERPASAVITYQRAPRTP